MTKKYEIEVCVASVESAIAAEQGKADRVELCDNLFEGGTTPSIGMIEAVREQIHIGLYVMIRPRGGDFLYSAYEYEIMKHDIVHAKNAGANGIVLGILTKDGNVDFERTAELTALARPLDVTFHRAIDMVSCPQKALETIIAAGCNRILTAGQSNKAFDGINQLKQMVEQAQGRVKIMAGSGVNDQNVKPITNNTGVTEFHLSGKKCIQGKMEYRNIHVFMGGLPEIPEYDIMVTDKEKVLSVFNTLNNG